MADLRPELFADDVLAAPGTLAEPPPGLESIRGLAERARRILFLGMGSSRFAALDAAALLRAHGIDAAAEIASTGSPQPPSADTLAFAISATGGSGETGTAMRRPPRPSMVAGGTSAPGSAVGGGGGAGPAGSRR